MSTSEPIGNPNKVLGLTLRSAVSTPSRGDGVCVCVCVGGGGGVDGRKRGEMLMFL